MSKRVLIARIITLLIALVALIYLYSTLTQPVGGNEQASVENSRLVWAFYGTGKRVDKLLSKPHGVAVDKNGDIYVSDGRQRVLVFDRNRRLKATLDPGLDPKKKNNFRGYLGVAVSDNGNVYIADKVQNKIFIVDPGGRRVGEINVMMPTALTVANNKLYAATYGPVIVYDLKGRQLKKFGRRGGGPNQFDFPGGIAADKKGNIYVSDSNNNRLVAVDPDGKPLWTVGKKGATMNDPNRTFGLPSGLTIDDNEILYMIDAFNGTIYAYNTNGKKLIEIGEWGQKEGQFYYPAGMTFAGGRAFTIADKYNDRLQTIELNVPGVKGAMIREDIVSELLRNPAFLWIIIAFVISVCAAIIWRRLQTSKATADARSIIPGS